MVLMSFSVSAVGSNKPPTALVFGDNATSLSFTLGGFDFASSSAFGDSVFGASVEALSSVGALSSSSFFASGSVVAAGVVAAGVSESELDPRSIAGAGADG